MMHHPQLTSLHTLFKGETQPFRKVHRMIDLFESLIKMHTVVILVEYVHHNKLSDAAKGMLSQGLRTPTLGIWHLFSKTLFKELSAQEYEFIVHFEKEFIFLNKALDAEKTNVIAMRNGYAHGATPSDAHCEADIQKFEPFLNQLLQFEWLQASGITEREGKVVLTTHSRDLLLHPVLLYRKEEQGAPYAFFNDLKNDKVGLLNYPLGKHYREQEFYGEFLEYLPVQEWKKTSNNEFHQRVEELTETFKGRLKERRKLLNFVKDSHKGYFSIQGNPGIGKSALIAQFFKDLSVHEEIKNLHVVEYFIRRGTQQAQAEYLLNFLINRTDALFPKGKEIRAEGKMLFDVQYQLFSKWRMWGEQCQGQKLLFLIDGLDEGAENNIVTYLPRENFENVLFIYGSRPGGHKSIDDLWGSLPVEHHTKLELSGLGKEDIRAMLYEVANKYEIGKESSWIDAVQQRSQGNPLYLKLLCDAIENGSIALNDINALPHKIDEYFKSILLRYANDPDGDALLSGLYTFAAAKDYLSIPHLGLINHLGDATLHRVGSVLKEVLYENPLTEEILDYQLFHESFREYLIREKGLNIREAAERLIDFCANWQTLAGTWEQRYTLEHYAAHLSESHKEARGMELLELLNNSQYQSTQKKVLKQFNASQGLLRRCLIKAGALNREDSLVEAALQMVDLRYEEANDAPQILAMLTDGDLDLALKRIETFGGTDKDGMQRKFILYMLCLMDLTLLKNKEKPHSKAAIDKLLQHLDTHIPVDHSLLDWNDFFPSYLIFQMSSTWAELGLEYAIVYKRTKKWDYDWLPEQGPYSDVAFEVLQDVAIGISSDREKSLAFTKISGELAKQGKFEEALSCATGISSDREKSHTLIDISTELAKLVRIEEALSCATCIISDFYKSHALMSISAELAKQGKLEEAASFLQEAHACAKGISNNLDKTYTLMNITTELAKQGNLEEAASIRQEAHASATGISVDWKKSNAFGKISAELAKQGKLEEAHSVLQEAHASATGISDYEIKNHELMSISTELAKQGKLEESASVLQEALSCVKGISNDRVKSKVLGKISSELAKQGKLEEAICVLQEAYACAIRISDDWLKSKSLMNIITEVVKQGKLEEALSYATDISNVWYKREALLNITTELAKQDKQEEALSCATRISNELDKSNAFGKISAELAKQDKLEEAASVLQEAYACAERISDDQDKIKALMNISNELAKQGKLEGAAYVLQEVLSCAKGISNGWYKIKALMNITTELAKQDKQEEALSCASGISNELVRSNVFGKISAELAKQGKLEEAASVLQDAYACAEGISDVQDKIKALMNISNELAKQGKLEEAASVLQEVLSCAKGISNGSYRIKALMIISIKLAKQGKLEEATSVLQEAYACAEGISDDQDKIKALMKISNELAKQGKLEEGTSVLQEAHASATGISNDWGKSSALRDISTALAKQSKLEEAFSCAEGISDDWGKSSALKNISAELAKQGRFEKALSCAEGISNDWKKSEALMNISNELAKQGKLEEATSVLQEAYACAEGMSDDWGKSRALRDISTALAKQDRLDEAESIGLEIPLIAERFKTWIGIAKEILEIQYLYEALLKSEEFKSEEAKLFYKRGWAENVNVVHANAELVYRALPFLAEDTESLEYLLQKYALHTLCFGKPQTGMVERLNQTLNVQWMMDIVAQFPQPQNQNRQSTNLEEWISSITDEDIRDQIELWAFKVSKGSMTEEAFAKKVASLLN